MNRSLKYIIKDLTKIQSMRENIIKNMRVVVIACNKAIALSHERKLEKAGMQIKKAKKLLIKNRNKVSNNLFRYMITAEQEYVEADSLLTIIEGKEIKSQNQLGVQRDSYILGLLDCIGELKRLTYYEIRNSKPTEASKIFNLMEKLYSSLYPLTFYDKIIKEMRRKIDVNRILIEDTRSAVTEEMRRTKLIETMKSIR
ncbi:MAG: RNA-binding protein [Thaumarchaeota archaeon]|nr:RNA-binding protein [Nitrososphaerota archaeon]